MKKTNILFILSDDHGYGDVSMHDGPNIHTPNIDRIASEGIRFSQFYANSTVCSPSRAALMTGRFPDRVGVPGVIRTHDENSWGYFNPDAVTLPQMLAPNGYHTAIIGKWHLGLEPENHPCARGFNEFRGFLGDMMDDYYTHLRHGENYMRHNRQVIDPKGHATELFTDWAIETIEEQTAAEKPFFIYLAYNAPHTPIQPPTEWFERIRHREPGVSEPRARYIALVEHMDANIGKVLDALDQTGSADNTLVVYASDNGGQVDAGACNAPFRGEKQDMYEGGIRVPCCAKWPGKIQPGQVNGQVAMLMDWFPTICEIAEAPITHGIEGESILPLLRGGHVDFSKRVCYWVRREGGSWRGNTYLGLTYHAVRRGNMKLLHNHPFAPLELYDVKNDAAENNNLAETLNTTEGISHESGTLDDPFPPHERKIHKSNASSPDDIISELMTWMQTEARDAGTVPWRKATDKKKR